MEADTPGVVLDPYIGSGTTAVAAKLLGHKYIGIDRSEAYMEMANARLDNAPSEMSKIREEQGLHFVKGTFKDRKSQGKHVGKYRTTDDEIEVIQPSLLER